MIDGLSDWLPGCPCSIQSLRFGWLSSAEAKSNSFYTQEPNKITDLKLWGQAWSSCCRPPASLISLDRMTSIKRSRNIKNGNPIRASLRTVWFHRMLKFELVLCTKPFLDVFGLKPNSPPCFCTAFKCQSIQWDIVQCRLFLVFFLQL